MNDFLRELIWQDRVLSSLDKKKRKQYDIELAKALEGVTDIEECEKIQSKIVRKYVK